MSSKQPIVIVTDKMDPHADAVILELRALGEEPIRLNRADLPEQSSITMRLAGAGLVGAIYAEDRVIQLEDIRSIWWRKPQPYRLPATLSHDERRFAAQEWNHALQGLWASLDCYWMSNPLHIRAASLKPEQLVRATALGFEAPKTLITTDPSEARAFYDQCDGRIIYKAMDDPLITGADPKISLEGATPQPVQGVYTTFIDEQKLELLGGVRFAPCQFQEYIEKRVELRVTIIGDEVFAAELDSQGHEQTRIDWRHYEVHTPVRPTTLPDEVAERCRQLTQGYGLTFSAIDLILTPDGRYVFIEINPNGQWLWVQEEAPEMKMKEALAACLMRGSN